MENPSSCMEVTGIGEKEAMWTPWACAVETVKENLMIPFYGCVVIRVFFGGSRSPSSMALDDDALLGTVRDQLREFMDIEAPPLFHRIYRWERSNAQYDVGHLDRVAALEAALPPGLFLTGSPYRGVGLPDCIKQGQEVAGQILVARREPQS